MPVTKAPPAPRRVGLTRMTGLGSGITPATTSPLKAMNAPAAMVSSCR